MIKQTFNYFSYYDYSQTSEDCNRALFEEAVAAEVTTTSSLEKESRPYPPEPSFLHPTSRDVQYTEVFTPGIAAKSVTELIWCDGYNLGMATTTTRKTFGLTADYTAYEGTNWPLDLRLKIKDKKINLGTSIVEYRQTARMFNNFANGLKSAWDLYRGRLPKKLRRRIRPCDIPASYLTGTYGIEPLVNDLFDSITELNSRMTKPMYQRSTSTSTRKSTDQHGGTFTVSEKAVAYLKKTHSHSAFTLGNVGELAWEVIPFSFVVDWGIGVGDYLSSLDALDGLEFLSGTVTTKVEYQQSNSTYNLPLYHNIVDSPAKVTYSGISRAVIGTIPLPSRPNVGFSASYRRLTNAVALLWAVNKRCKA
jgi:hypothetical protein